MNSVYVLNKYGHPLMPCSPSKARHLLNNKAAIVKHRTPFTIQLLYGSSGYTQNIILGVDAGSKTVGLSASTKKKECFAANVILRNDVTKLLSTRQEFRKTRRFRKTRYRKPRFNNRTCSKQKGWIAPSIEVKIQEHITVIKRICKILPINKIVVETTEFDLQQLKATIEQKPTLDNGGYQTGEMYGYYNTRQYILWRDKYTCQCCGAHTTDKERVKFHIHHLESRKTGGNAPDNLITLCKDCHERVHKGVVVGDEFKKRKRRSVRDAAFMGIMRKKLLQRLRFELLVPIIETQGYITKATREQLLKLPKSHTNDALAIAQGRHGFDAKYPLRIVQTDKIYTIRPVRHHNRQLHKATILKGGYRKSNQAKKYTFGYRLFDKVEFGKQDCFVWGRRTSGHFLIKTIDGNVVTKSISFKKLRLVERANNYLIA